MAEFDPVWFREMVKHFPVAPFAEKAKALLGIDGTTAGIMFAGEPDPEDRMWQPRRHEAAASLRGLVETGVFMWTELEDTPETP